MIYLQLFWEFFKTGLFAIGGGLATLPFLQEMGQRTGWFTTHQLTDMLAVSECTPGAIGINMATYAGFRTAGLPGAICSTIGIITPSIIVIIIVAGILKKFQDNKYVQALFYGLRPASSGLIGAACVGVGAVVLFDFGGVSIVDFLTGLAMEAGTGAALISERFATAVNWEAVALAVVLWLLMNLGRMERFKGNKVLGTLSTIHPVFFLAASAVIGIVFGFA